MVWIYVSLFLSYYINKPSTLSTHLVGSPQYSIRLLWLKGNKNQKKKMKPNKWGQHSPTCQAADLPATKILHSFGVHGWLSRSIGHPPEKQPTCKIQHVQIYTCAPLTPLIKIVVSVNNLAKKKKVVCPLEDRKLKKPFFFTITSLWFQQFEYIKNGK